MNSSPPANWRATMAAIAVTAVLITVRFIAKCKDRQRYREPAVRSHRDPASRFQDQLPEALQPTGKDCRAYLLTSLQCKCEIRIPEASGQLFRSPLPRRGLHGKSRNH